MSSIRYSDWVDVNTRKSCIAMYTIKYIGCNLTLKNQSIETGCRKNAKLISIFVSEEVEVYGESLADWTNWVMSHVIIIETRFDALYSNSIYVLNPCAKKRWGLAPNVYATVHHPVHRFAATNRVISSITADLTQRDWLILTVGDFTSSSVYIAEQQIAPS